MPQTIEYRIDRNVLLTVDKRTLARLADDMAEHARKVLKLSEGCPVLWLADSSKPATVYICDAKDPQWNP